MNSGTNAIFLRTFAPLMGIARVLLSPLALLYGGVLRVRHALYDAGMLKSTTPGLPVIAIGNLALGGTGKTPMLELVLRILAGTAPAATLSRGYGRKGSGILEVEVGDAPERSGDEPLQVKRKFPHARVFVGADRVRAIEVIQEKVPGVKVVILDDALQHRALKAGLNILLTTWQRPWYNDALLPAGTLRDLPARARAADIIVVTKCPALPAEKDREMWRKKLGAGRDQQVYFSKIAYDHPVMLDSGTAVDPKGHAVLLFTGIADPAPLIAHLRSLCRQLEHVKFSDHHYFTQGDLRRLAAHYVKFAPGPKMLVTTEKDAARLSSMLAGSPIEGLPLAVIGMRAEILNNPERFGGSIKAHVGTYQAHR